MLLLALGFLLSVLEKMLFPLTYGDASFCSDYLFKLLLIGDSGVGKSCLLLRFAVSLIIFMLTSEFICLRLLSLNVVLCLVVVVLLIVKCSVCIQKKLVVVCQREQTLRLCYR